MTMGMDLIPGPRIDNSFMLVRDRRGIQLVNLKKGTSHQLVLSSVGVDFADIDFLKVLYDEQTHQTHVVTIYYEDYPKKVRDNIDVADAADNQGNKPIMSLSTFNREF